MPSFDPKNRRGGCETTLILERCGSDLTRYLIGDGVDFGCEFDPVPGAKVLVDAQPPVHAAFQNTHEVHIRDVNRGFADWIEAGRQFDFVYSSHLLEHVVDPHALLRTFAEILKPGGHLILVLPDCDWYWPNGHPNANPDHRWWHLSPEKVLKWIGAAFGNAQGGMAPTVFRSDATACEGGAWSFVLVCQRP